MIGLRADAPGPGIVVAYLLMVPIAWASGRSLVRPKLAAPQPE